MYIHISKLCNSLKYCNFLFYIFEKQLNVEKDETNDSCLTSPASTIESLTRELEHSLDLHSATKGQYIVNHLVCYILF